MHNLKKYFGILDYALRVFSKCFPLYEIPLNISTLFRPVHCVSFYKIAFKRSSLYEANTNGFLKHGFQQTGVIPTGNLHI